MPVTRFEQVFFSYFDQFKRLIDAAPLLLGAVSGAGGGFGGRPGGFSGVLPQTRVAFDTDEAEIWEIPESGSLLDNLNRIRYRIANIEGITEGLSIYEDGVLISSGVTVIDFITDNVEETSPGHVTISGGGITFLDLTDTPDTYTSQANKYVTVKGDTTGVEFTTLVPSGDSLKVKVSSDDTTEDWLSSKLSAGTNIQFNILNEGGNEQIQITSISGVTDHGLLTGLGDDDHTQYLDTARHDLIARHTLGSVVPHDAITGLSDTNIVSPQIGENLVYDGTYWVNSPFSASQRVMTFGVMGTLEVKTLEPRLHAPFTGEIVNITAAVNTAPAGNSIIIDVFKNSSTVFTTSANRPTISGGSQQDLSSIPDITSFNLNDVFTVEIAQVGSSTAGADLVLQIRCVTTV